MLVPKNPICWVGVSLNHKAPKRLAGPELSFSFVRLWGSGIVLYMTQFCSTTGFKAILGFDSYLFIQNFPLIGWLTSSEKWIWFLGKSKICLPSESLFLDCIVSLKISVMMKKKMLIKLVHLGVFCIWQADFEMPLDI